MAKAYMSQVSDIDHEDNADLTWDESAALAFREAKRILSETEPLGANCGKYGCSKHGTTYMGPTADEAGVLAEALRSFIEGGE